MQGVHLAPGSTPTGSLIMENPQQRVEDPPDQIRDTKSTNGATNLTLMAGGVALLLLLPLLYTIYRCRKRNVQSYEDIPEGGNIRKRHSRCSQASIVSCNQNRPIDFVLPSVPPALPCLTSPNPGDNISIASSDSMDMPLWARLAMLDPGPTLLGGLNPELYRLSAEQPEEEVCFPDDNVGRIWVSLEYESNAERLTVNIIKIKNLPSRGYGSVNCCDPFVRIYVLPDERRYLQTKMKKKTCNPNFDESFVFQIPAKNIEERTIKLTVLDSDRGKHFNVIGNVFIPLKEIDFTTQETETLWRDLIKDSEEVPSNLGEMLVSLCYNQTLERLTVTICEAKGLKPPEGQSVVDSYVKLTLMQDNKAVKTKKTMVAKKTVDPQYNESFHFRLAKKSLGSASVVVQVTMSGGSQKDKVLGRIVFGSYMFVRGKPLEHWNETISAGYKQIRYWHKLT